MSTFKYENLSESQEKELSALWEWFLTNINEGIFERISKNAINLRKLDQFITTHAQNYNSNLFVLVLPTEKLQKSPNFLIDVLSKFYNDNDINHNVTITHMGQIQKLQASLILIKDDHALSMNTLSVIEKAIPRNVDMESVISGEADYVPSLIKYNDDFDDGEDTESSIMSNEGLSKSIGVSLECVDSTEASIYNENLQNCAQFKCEETSDSESSIASSDISEQLSALQPFPTRISSISSGVNSCCSLILKTILLKDIQSGEIKTAIRQISDEESSDDWLLYDSSFSLDNLQMLNFSEIFDYDGHLKILFYSFEAQDIHDLSSDQESIDDDDDLMVMKFNGIDEYTGPITFTTSHNTTITTPTNFLSKTSTLKTIAGHQSINSEYMVHKPDPAFSGISKSKSEPVGSHLKRLRQKRKQKQLNDKSCIVM